MKIDGKYDIGEFLFRFYRKRCATFLVNIYKAGITGSSRDIHRARLDVKKILAIIDLLRIVRPKSDKDPAYEKVFKKLYQSSGRIREIQVNLLLLTSPEFAPYDLKPFKQELLKQESARTREFLGVIRKFDEQKLSLIEKKIKKETGKITPSTLRKKTGRYITYKTALCLELFESGAGEANLHQVRQHIKELSTVLTLIYSINPSWNLEKVISGLNRSEMMIGDWHDRTILAESLGEFLNTAGNIPESQLDQAQECCQAILSSNESQVESIILDVRQAIAASTTDADG
ncbi:MAG: CHAD domain-containing protein [Bacteroidota bacterium]